MSVLYSIIDNNAKGTSCFHDLFHKFLCIYSGYTHMHNALCTLSSILNHMLSY